jgi:GNAT superfamily N-acetyltransferase
MMAGTEILRRALALHDAQPEDVRDNVTYRWRGPLTDEEMVELVDAHGGNAEAGWWTRIRPRSFGWVTARDADGHLIGFVNVVSDGGDHAFLIDTKTHGHQQRKGVGTATVRFAAERAKAAGCEWLHVDFEPHLSAFYFDSCGFRRTEAGLIHLPSLTT